MASFLVWFFLMAKLPTTDTDNRLIILILDGSTGTPPRAAVDAATRSNEAVAQNLRKKNKALKSRSQEDKTATQSRRAPANPRRKIASRADRADGRYQGRDG
ncbi:hypothetical protein QBC39DRAFT_331148 [Podospora conica]|nr:hypothetical protein QBC39DRAFT_331148 [Schizothecium conicum]